MSGDLESDVSKASLSFFVVAVFLALLGLYSYFSPLALHTDLALEVAVLRALGHFLPVQSAPVANVYTTC